MSTQTQTERRAWDLLTRDFYWELPPDFAVKVYEDQKAKNELTRLQIFEVIVATVFASLRPEYDWYVTPNRPDGGLDFVGKHHFLEDDTLGIAATITVGGQCKKRTTVDDIVGEVAGSLARMASTLDPTFFVVALSARLNQKRVDEARKILERTHQRHCHILDRGQIEGLMCDHLPTVHQILRQGLCEPEIEEVLAYLDARQEAPGATSIDVQAPERVLAGIPFCVQVSVRSPIVSAPASRLWWTPQPTNAGTPLVKLIGPIGADEQAGVELIPNSATDDPILMRCSIELVTYSVGEIDLGKARIGPHASGGADDGDPIALGHVQVVDNMRPRFYPTPFRAGLAQLHQGYERALAAGVGAVGVVVPAAAARAVSVKSLR